MNSRSFAVIVAFAALSGCVVDDSTPVAVAGDGMLTVEFTVDGTSDPAECTFQGADSIDVVVTTPNGAVVTEVTDDCRNATTSIDLPPGSYYADAVLLDHAGHTITTTVDLGGFHIYGDVELVVHADFPPDSFF